MEAAGREQEAISIGHLCEGTGGGCEGIGGILYIWHSCEGIWRQLGGNKRHFVLGTPVRAKEAAVRELEELCIYGIAGGNLEAAGREQA